LETVTICAPVRTNPRCNVLYHVRKRREYDSGVSNTPCVMDHHHLPLSCQHRRRVAEADQDAAAGCRKDPLAEQADVAAHDHPRVRLVQGAARRRLITGMPGNAGAARRICEVGHVWNLSWLDGLAPASNDSEEICRFRFSSDTALMKEFKDRDKLLKLH
jgi:hypothetical protein